jgi:hypothetical protein
LGERLQKKVLGPFVYVFLILLMEVSYGVVSYGEDEGDLSSYTQRARWAYDAKDLAM